MANLELDLWFRYFNETGISLISLFLGKKRARLVIIDKEIKDIREKLLPFKATPEYYSLSTNLKTHLEKEEKEQRVKKQKKYTRDASDYKNHQVFSWQSKDSVLGTDDIHNSTMEVSAPPTDNFRLHPSLSTQFPGTASRSGTNRKPCQGQVMWLCCYHPTSGVSAPTTGG